MRLAVLGGSSPFLAELFVELGARIEASGAPPIEEIVLQGRNLEALQIMARFVGLRLPWARVRVSQELEAAIGRADLILHQPRYGGLDGRADDEAYARQLGLPADETLGPAGLRAALRFRDPILAVGRAIARAAPDAVVLNMTNPLSLSTSLLKAAGLERVVGLCELPLVTAFQVADRLGVQPSALSWDYVGLNHRGFLFDLKAREQPVLERLVERLGEGTIGGVGGAAMLELQAVPTKYFRLFTGAAPVSGYGRAAFLDGLRSRILEELRLDPEHAPPSLAGREQPWWRHAVAPALEALAGDEPRDLVLNVPGPDLVTREGWFRLSRGGIEAATSARPSALVTGWVRRFEEHERACLDALLEPGEAAQEAALRLDPLMTAGPFA